MISNLLMVLLLISSAETLTFQKELLVFDNGKKVTVELAQSMKERMQGLMHRENLGSNEGMMFIFPSEQPMSFWMKNTYIPLSVGFFSKKGVLLEVIDMEPVRGPASDSQMKIYQSSQSGIYALEVPLGWFKKNNVNIGAKFKLQKLKNTP